MQRAAQFFLFVTLILWGTLIGAIMYSHIAFFPAYLDHLPGSAVLVNGPYAIRDDIFWMRIHPVLIVCLIITLIINWKLVTRRKYIIVAACIYALAIIATFTYFVPELMAFAKSNDSNIPAAEWLQRGKKWQYLSWIRGFFMYLGFVLLLISLTKNKTGGSPANP